MSLEQKIEELITPSLEAMGLELVQLKVVSGQKSKVLQVFADNPATGRITVDECAKASRTISALLDVEDLISGQYNLEVGSPGIDRPLVKPADYEKYQGFDVKVETALMVNGRRRFKGPLKEVNQDGVVVVVDGEPYQIDFSNINNAKLVLSDALIKAHQDGVFNAKQPVTA